MPWSYRPGDHTVTDPGWSPTLFEVACNFSVQSGLFVWSTRNHQLDVTFVYLKRSDYTIGWYIETLSTHLTWWFNPTKWVKFDNLFQELLNRYQACLYLFECISHDDSGYGNWFKIFFKLCCCWKFKWNFRPLSFAATWNMLTIDNG